MDATADEMSGALLEDAMAGRQLDYGPVAALDPFAIRGDAARIAFWLNAYNALLLGHLAEHPANGSMLRKLRMFSSTELQVGRERYSLSVIEHGLLRCNARPPYWTLRTLGARDSRLAAAPSRLDPRVHFALNCGARSCPAVRVYRAAILDEQLEQATAGYLRAEAEVGEDEVTLPGLMKLYRGDFGSRDAQLAFVAERLPELRALLARGEPRVRYARFDWTAVRPTSGAS